MLCAWPTTIERAIWLPLLDVTLNQAYCCICFFQLFCVLASHKAVSVSYIVLVMHFGFWFYALWLQRNGLLNRHFLRLTFRMTWCSQSHCLFSDMVACAILFIFFYFYFFWHVLCNSCILGCEYSLHVGASKFRKYVSVLFFRAITLKWSFSLKKWMDILNSKLRTTSLLAVSSFVESEARLQSRKTNLNNRVEYKRASERAKNTTER